MNFKSNDKDKTKSQLAQTSSRKRARTQSVRIEWAESSSNQDHDVHTTDKSNSKPEKQPAK